MPGFEILQQNATPTSSILTATYGGSGGGYAVAPGGNIVVNNDPVPVIVGTGGAQSGPVITNPTNSGAQQEAVLDPGTPTILPAVDTVAGGEVAPNGTTANAKKWYEHWYVWVAAGLVIAGGFYWYKKTSGK